MKLDYNPLIVALDFDDLDTALKLAGNIKDNVGVFKVGLQLYTKYGPECVRELKKMGCEIFLDLKLHDIPNTVYKAAREVCELGVKFFTVHSTGGVAMLEAAQKAVNECAGPKPCVLGVSILTSMDENVCKNEVFMQHGPDVMVPKLAQTMVSAGIGGMVCSPSDVVPVRQAVGDKLVVVTPGVRPEWAAVGDHAKDRIMTPAKAVSTGSDYIVVGRPITANADPVDAAARIVAEFK